MNTVEIVKFEAYKKKLTGICDENDLNFKFRYDRYPIMLTIYPVTGLDSQMSMFESVEERGYKGADASIVFIAKDGGLTYKTCDIFTIDDALFSKIKNLFKNMCSMWWQHFFHDVVERGVLSGSTFPSITVEELPGNDFGGDGDDMEDAFDEGLDIDDAADSEA